jgi:hypothetical protein
MPHWLQESKGNPMASVLNEAYFHDEAAAFGALETILWPNGPTCPLCGNHDASKIGALKGVRSKPSKKTPRALSALASRSVTPAVANSLSERAPFLRPAT